MCTIGNLFHVKHRSRDGMVDEDALLQFIDIQDANKPDRILMLSSPLDDITQHAWKTSQIQQFRITDLGISIEFCPNCYKTHILQHRSFNMFIHTSVLNACVEFICNNTKAVASDVSFNSFITIYKIKDHHCPPPSTPPPPVPSNIDIQPPIPSRNHPRLGYSNAPSAKPLPKYSDLVSPYKITNKIIINNDGSISQESTILGKNENVSAPNPLKPPRVQKNVRQSTASHMAQIIPRKQVTHRSLCRNTSGKLVPPKHIKRTGVPKPVPAHPKVDVSVDDHVKDRLFDGYVEMKSNSNLAKFQSPLSLVVRNVKSSDFLNTKVHLVNPAPSNGSHSTSVEDDKTDQEYITLPDSPEPIPRRTKTSDMSPVQKRFDLSMQLKEKEDVNVTNGVHTNTDIIELTFGSDDESKSRASPKVPARNVRAVESCDHIFSVDSCDVFTEDAIIQGCQIGLYMLYI